MKGGEVKKSIGGEEKGLAAGGTGLVKRPHLS